MANWRDKVSKDISDHLEAQINESTKYKKAYGEAPSKSNAQLWIAIGTISKQIFDLNLKMNYLEGALKDFDKRVLDVNPSKEPEEVNLDEFTKEINEIRKEINETIKNIPKIIPRVEKKVEKKEVKVVKKEKVVKKPVKKVEKKVVKKIKPKKIAKKVVKKINKVKKPVKKAKKKSLAKVLRKF
ncbi:hypothetical protein CL617_00350 [archaeon]|nr:hypothetical protein [archaeon]|tara:strand:- start:543 stop:1094 length:552 start_codon:yes stop_codon:yes gene_type:complete